jgi:hypothetical protein
MVYIEKIAFHLGRRDEEPNKALAALLVEEENHAGIAEIVEHLGDKNTSIQSDCIAVLYQIGYLSPALISRYAPEFIKLLDSKHNRMVWGAMIALATIAEETPEAIFPYLDKIKMLIETGTVITNVWGVKTLINLSKAGEQYYQALHADLLRLQKECRKVDFAKRAEDMWAVIQPEHLAEYRSILLERKPTLSTSAQKRLERVIEKIG